MKKLELTNTEAQFLQELIQRYWQSSEDFGLVDDYPLEPHQILAKLENPKNQDHETTTIT